MELQRRAHEIIQEEEEAQQAEGNDEFAQPPSFQIAWHRAFDEWHQRLVDKSTVRHDYFPPPVEWQDDPAPLPQRGERVPILAVDEEAVAKAVAEALNNVFASHPERPYFTYQDGRPIKKTVALWEMRLSSLPKATLLRSIRPMRRSKKPPAQGRSGSLHN